LSTDDLNDIGQYDYELPLELIAQEPTANRADSRLMVVHRHTGELEHAYVRDLADYLRAGDCVVINDTRVIPARLVGYRKSTGGKWQGLYLRSDDQGIWQILCKTRGKLFPGEEIVLKDLQGEDDISLRLLTRFDEGVWIAVPDSDEETFPLLERIGRIPLPHYIRRGEMVAQDRKDYQTVYAVQRGSVAAPTAGLHFTEKLLRQLMDRGVGIERVTLHIGAGTFRPITVPRLEAHQMHSEWCDISADTAQRLNEVRAGGGRVIAVGTTSARTLETAAASGRIAGYQGETQLFIHPPYRFQAIDGLLTNFHLPRSTLFVLVKTFGGHRLIQTAYETAIAERYRFYSYGDAMLIL